MHQFAEKVGMYKHNENIMNGINGKKGCYTTPRHCCFSKHFPKRAREHISLQNDAPITDNMKKVLTVMVSMLRIVLQMEPGVNENSYSINGRQ